MRGDIERDNTGGKRGKRGNERSIRLPRFPGHRPGAALALTAPCRHREGDRCLLYFNQPRRFQNFLAVKYIVSSRGAGYATHRRALEALDEVARIKGVDAMLCDLANRRITESMMRRWGWEPHKPSLWHRHFIKRFYGTYPSRATWLTSREGDCGE